jgi:hypothetical protein
MLLDGLLFNPEDGSGTSYETLVSLHQITCCHVQKAYTLQPEQASSSLQKPASEP